MKREEVRRLEGEKVRSETEGSGLTLHLLTRMRRFCRTFGIPLGQRSDLPPCWKVSSHDEIGTREEPQAHGRRTQDTVDSGGGAR